MISRTKCLALLPALIACAVFLFASAASAQSVVIDKVDIPLQRFTSHPAAPTWISRADCLNDAFYTFRAQFENAAGLELQVWAGTDNCEDPATRTTGSAPTCWLVGRVGAAVATTLTVRVRDIVARNFHQEQPNGPGSGTEADCTSTTTGDPISVSLNFLLIEGTDQFTGGRDVWPTKYDLGGPPAPTAITAGVGEERIVLNWKAPASNDLASYNFYCDPKRGEAAPAFTPQQVAEGGIIDGAVPDATGGAGGDASVGTGGTGGVAVDGGGGTTLDGGGGTAATGGGSGGNAECPSSVIIADVVPTSDEFLCGTASGSTGAGEADGLTNGVTYAVAIAAVDELNNVGPLSTVKCARPAEVDDFFELYRRAGGEGGGGFCAIGARPAPGAAVALALAWLLRRLRKRARS